jgi:hypothetical protein
MGLTLNGKKNYASSTIKCIGEVNTFLTLDIVKFLMCSVDLNMVTIGGMTHIKMIFSLLPGISKHFISNTLCSSDNSVMQLIYSFHFFTTHNVFNKPPEEKIKPKLLVLSFLKSLW